MEQGMIDKAIAAGKSERWITQIENGVVTHVQRIEADEFVVRLLDLPRFASNSELVSDSLARDILRAIGKRQKIRCGEGELIYC